MALEQQTIALIGVGVVIIGVTVGLHSITQADIRALGASVDGLRGDVSSLGERVAAVETRLTTVETRLTSVETRLSHVENRIVDIDGRLAHVETDLNTFLALGQGVEPSSYVLDAPSAEEYPRNAQELDEPTTVEVAVDTVAEAMVVAEIVDVASADDIVLVEATAYRIVKEKDSSFGNVRRRVTLEIEIDGADPTAPTTIEAMMQAAAARHQVDQPDAVSVRLWRSYANDSNAENRLVYASDGCGWSGGDCTGESWTDLLKGDIPHG